MKISHPRKFPNLWYNTLYIVNSISIKRQRQRERQRETDRQTDRETEREKERPQKEMQIHKYKVHMFITLFLHRVTIERMHI